MTSALDLIAERRREAGRKAAETRRLRLAGGTAPARSGPAGKPVSRIPNGSRSDLLRLLAMVQEHADRGVLAPDLAALGASLMASLERPATSPKAAPVPAALEAPIDSSRYAPWADYPIVRRFKADRPGPTCVVAFDDGTVTRMTVATLPGKPLNIGRALRIAVRAWEERKRPAPPSAEKIEKMIVRKGKRGERIYDRNKLDALLASFIAPVGKPPKVTAIHFEIDDEIIARFDPADANAALHGRTA